MKIWRIMKELKSLRRSIDKIMLEKYFQQFDIWQLQHPALSKYDGKKSANQKNKNGTYKNSTNQKGKTQHKDNQCRLLFPSIRLSHVARI